MLSNKLRGENKWGVCVGYQFNMMTSSNGNIFRITGPLWGKSTLRDGYPLTKASGAELWFFCAWTNSWANDRDAGDLRRHRAYHDVTLMSLCLLLACEMTVDFVEMNGWTLAVVTEETTGTTFWRTLNVHAERARMEFIHYPWEIWTKFVISNFQIMFWW